MVDSLYWEILAENAFQFLKEANLSVFDRVEGVSKISSDKKIYIPKGVELSPGDRVAWINVDGAWVLRKIGRK